MVLRASSLAAARAASAATTASRAGTTASSLGCSSALAVASRAESSIASAAAFALASSACSLASADDADASARSEASSCASALSFRFSATRTGTIACAASRETLKTASSRLISFFRRLLRFGGSGGCDSAGIRLRLEQSRVNDRDRRNVGGRHNHTHAQAGHVEEAFGKPVRQPDTAVRRRMPRHNSTMKGDPRPGEALHMGHGGIVI